MNRLFLAAIVLFAPCLMYAAPADFSVTIVGTQQFQGHQSDEKLADKDKGYPVITVPIQANSKEAEQPTRPEFYVVIRNASKKPIRLDFASDDWDDCLEFQVTGIGRKVFTIIRGGDQTSIANPSANWVFQPGDLRVLPVNFTTQRWEGLPANSNDLPRVYLKIKATFRFYVPKEKKDRRFDSDIIDARTY